MVRGSSQNQSSARSTVLIRTACQPRSGGMVLSSNIIGRLMLDECCGAVPKFPVERVPHIRPSERRPACVAGCPSNRQPARISGLVHTPPRLSVRLWWLFLQRGFHLTYNAGNVRMENAAAALTKAPLGPTIGKPAMCGGAGGKDNERCLVCRGTGWLFVRKL